MAIEHIAQMEVPKRGQYIRVIVAELERLHSHYLWMGLACHLIGFDSMFMYIWNAREKVMDILEEISGNRVNYGMNIIGGARRDITDDMRKKVLSMLDEMSEPNKRMMEVFTQDKTLAMRTKGVGLLPKEDALRLGTIGPHARASGIKIDVRKDAPYSSYDDFEFDVPVQTGCDVWSRVAVRMLEVEESIKIIKQAINNLPEGPINLGVRIPKVPAGEFTTRHEAPRGELIYYVITDGGPTNYRISIHVPTFKTASTVEFMLKGNTIADSGLIIASIDPCFSCLDR
jgi:Ni,Fe-hydrogenase III large subunit